MSYAYFESREDGVGRLVLNRPEKLNAFSLQMIDDFTHATGEAQKSIAARKTRVVWIESETEKAFCAGADLKERMLMDEIAVSQTLKKQRAMVDAVAALEVPTIALMRGIAFGGGFELALACDFRVAHPEAQMGLTEVRLGIIPGAGGTQRLRRIVGETLAKDLIMRGRRLTAEEAHKLGLVHLADNLHQVAQALTLELMLGAPLALKAAKKAIEEGAHLALPKALDHERACYDICLKSQDREEGLKAFSEKRAPQYKGQ